MFVSVQTMSSEQIGRVITQFRHGFNVRRTNKRVNQPAVFWSRFKSKHNFKNSFDRYFFDSDKGIEIGDISRIFMKI